MNGGDGTGFTGVLGVLRRLLANGVSPEEAIQLIAETESNRAVRRRLSATAGEIAHGFTPGLSLARNLGPGIGLKDADRALLAMAESTEALHFAVGFCELDSRLERLTAAGLAGALTYPLTVVLAVAAVAVFLLHSILPTLLGPAVEFVRESVGNDAVVATAMIPGATAVVSLTRNLRPSRHMARWVWMMAAITVLLAGDRNLTGGFRVLSPAAPRLIRGPAEAFYRHLRSGRSIPDSLRAAAVPAVVVRHVSAALSSPNPARDLSTATLALLDHAVGATERRIGFIRIGATLAAGIAVLWLAFRVVVPAIELLNTFGSFL